VSILKSILHINFLNSANTIADRISSGHGILVTLIGVIAVFIGLIILWGVTSNFQKIVRKIEGKTQSKRTANDNIEITEQESEMDNSAEIALAIGVAISYELEEDEVSVITLRHIEQEMSPWVVASRPVSMRRL
jgi:Na+-transporting methylmalonyl-CoA/oxaloacetate decarboxylase gamma subunit